MTDEQLHVPAPDPPPPPPQRTYDLRYICPNCGAESIVKMPYGVVANRALLLCAHCGVTAHQFEQATWAHGLIATGAAGKSIGT